MRENLVYPWQSKIEAKLHEESKFWRASKPLPNQSSMQGRESKKESNIQQFCNPFAKYSQACELPKRRTSLAKLRMNFATPCEIFASQKEFRKACKTEEFRNPLRYFCKPEGISQAKRKFHNPFSALRNFRNLTKSS